MHDRMIALADCNNFFVSCERRADPSLDGVPVVVLSSNDGCVISRSNEAKELGVKMGAPYFKVRDFLSANGVAVRSSSVSLYRDMSAEVMDRVRRYSDTIEVYSIDECFFNMAIASVRDPVEYCRALREAVWNSCRIPLSVGIAPTKTLCKLASEYAKKHVETGGVFWLDRSAYDDAGFMRRFLCRDIWGIGAARAKRLEDRGVMTAADFMRKDDMWVKCVLDSAALYTLWELKGRLMYPIISESSDPKSVRVSRSFGSPLVAYDDLLSPLLCFVSAAVRQLRMSRQAARRMSVYIETSRFVRCGCYSASREAVFPEPKFWDADFMSVAKDLLGEIYVPGYKYKRCGVVLSSLSDMSRGAQTSLFEERGGLPICERKRRAANAVDLINAECGGSVIKPAVLFDPDGVQGKWVPKSEHRRQGAQTSDGSNLPVCGRREPRFQNSAADFIR
jgi:DNA polymerase V